MEQTENCEILIVAVVVVVVVIVALFLCANSNVVTRHNYEIHSRAAAVSIPILLSDGNFYFV